MKHLNKAHEALNLSGYENREFGSRSEFMIVDGNSLSIKIQDGPIKESGVNGIQITDVLGYCLEVYKSFNSEFPCRENSLTITKIEEALHWQEARTRDRVKRDVEGFNKP